MPKPNKKIIPILVFIFLIAFFVFSIPNSKGSDNLAMVQMFEPDEGVCLPVVQNMIIPKSDFFTFLWKFVFYDFYSYGFPYFATSAVVLLPLQWLNQIQHTPLVMLVLRQMISVFPMLVALLLLVYIQDKFQTYRSILLFIFLLSVPAFIQNGLWWHPDGLVLLLSVLVLFFLWKDNRQFSWRFFAASITCGVLVATKMVGVYFFLAIGMILIWGWIEKKISFKKLAALSAIFLLIMGISFIIANPFLLSEWARIGYFYTIRVETNELSQGYGLVYEKGLKEAWPIMHQFYGETIFLVISLLVSIWGIWKKQQRFLYALTLAWFFPLTVSLLVVTHFKYQYWLPVAIPLFSNLVMLLPQKITELKSNIKSQGIRILLLVIVLFQFVLFVRQDISTLVGRTNRQENNPRIGFYDQAIGYLKPINSYEVNVYYDYRLYVPETSGWKIETTYDLLTYAYINEHKFDVLFLLESRIHDYLNPNATGVDPIGLKESRMFYQDAEDGNISKYTLLFKNETARLYVLNETCKKFLDVNICN
ncbi:MAG: hypothetical protein NTZ74_03550 [Chloroflexi bacterium]|nr:hypothetical protein [Chloroflexota bacterium]